MHFEAWTAEQYRTATPDALEERRNTILQLADEPGDADVDLVASESRACAAEIERRNAAGALRRSAIDAVTAGAGDVVGRMAEQRASEAAEDDDPSNTLEYRRAFMDYVRTGRMSDPIREVRAWARENRSDANTLTTDVPAVIPTMLVNRILEKAETIGMILPLVTKTSYPAGIEIPVASLKPVATWVNEGATSDKQKYTANQKVTFTHHKLRCEVSISMEVGTLALSAFESRIVDSVARAITVAKEEAILNGTGSGQPKGILTETPAEGQAIEVAAGESLSYELLCEAEAALPQAYESGARWFMSKKTFYGFVGMTDSSGQPVARVDHGIGGRPERTLLGREVVLTGDYLPSFEDGPEQDTVFAFLFDMGDYVMNSIYDMGVSRRQDWDTEDLQTKAVTSCDGKVIDVNSLVTLTAKKSE